MRKHLAVLKTGLQDSFAYRAQSVVWMFVEFLPIIMLSFVWLDVYKERALVGGFSKEQLVTYYLGSLLIGRLVSWYIHHDIAREIRYGHLSLFLVKPYNYLMYRAVSNAGSRLMRYIILAPFFVFLIVNFKRELYIESNLINYLMVIPALVLAFFLFLSISALLGVLAFWVKKVDGIYNFYWVVRNIFSGNLIPIALLPSVFVSVAKVLPFRYTFSFPLEIYFSQLKVSEILLGFTLGLFWLVLNYSLLRLLWSTGLKRYSSVGG